MGLVPKRDSPVALVEPQQSDLTVVRHSEMADFRQCPLKWWLAWVCQWRNGDSAASSLGTAWHEVMAHHFEEIQRWQQRGENPPKDWLGAVSVIEYFKETPHYDTLVWMYEGYLEKWGASPEWEIIEFESTQQVEIMPGIWYEWTTDVLVEDHRLRKLRVVDHKSTSNQLRKIDADLSDQTGLYVKAQTLRGRAVADGLINQARTSKLKRPMTLEERYAQISTYRSPTELDNIWDDAKATIRDILRWRESGETPYSAPDPRICSWKCDYVETHLILRKTPRHKWEQRLGPLMRTRGFEQKEAPRGSDRATFKTQH